MDQNQLEEVASFTYLGSIIIMDGGADEDVMARIEKTRTTFNILNIIWKAKNISLKTKPANFQLTCQIHPTLRIRNLEDDHQHPQQTPDILQPLPLMPPWNLLAQHHLKCELVGSH